MTEPPAIRPARPEDAAGIMRVYMESARHHAALDPERYSVPDPGEILARYRDGRQHPHDPGITLVAETAGETAGFVDVRLERPIDPMHRRIVYCYVAEIAVREELRSSGIGAALMRAAEDWGRANGAEFASLDYVAANTRAAGFYERLGYRRASMIAVKRL